MFKKEISNLEELNTKEDAFENEEDFFVLSKTLYEINEKIKKVEKREKINKKLMIAIIIFLSLFMIGKIADIIQIYV